MVLHFLYKVEKLTAFSFKLKKTAHKEQDTGEQQVQTGAVFWTTSFFYMKSLGYFLRPSPPVRA